MPEHCKWDIRMVAVHGRRPGRSALPMWSGRWPVGPNFEVRSVTPSVYAIREHTVTSWQGPLAAQLRVQFQPEVCEQRFASQQKVGFVLLVVRCQRQDASIAPHKKAWSVTVCFTTLWVGFFRLHRQHFQLVQHYTELYFAYFHCYTVQ